MSNCQKGPVDTGEEDAGDSSYRCGQKTPEPKVLKKRVL